MLDQLMKVSLTGVTLHVMGYARTLVIGVVLPHFNGTFAGVVLLAVWGTITCFVASRGLGLLVRVGELRAKTYLSPGSGAALGGGMGLFALVPRTLIHRTVFCTPASSRPVGEGHQNGVPTTHPRQMWGEDIISMA
jgi:hypothetical protein